MQDSHSPNQAFGSLFGRGKSSQGENGVNSLIKTLHHASIMFAHMRGTNSSHTGDKRSSKFSLVCPSHETLLWYESPSHLLNCDLSGSMPCPLNEHVHWNTLWGPASSIWTNTSAEEFSLPLPSKMKLSDQWRTPQASEIMLNMGGSSATLPQVSVERRGLSS